MLGKQEEAHQPKRVFIRMASHVRPSDLSVFNLSYFKLFFHFLLTWFLMLGKQEEAHQPKRVFMRMASHVRPSDLSGYCESELATNTCDGSRKPVRCISTCQRGGGL
jgi:hypothetical protein